MIFVAELVDFGWLFGAGLLLRSGLFRAGTPAPEPKEAHADKGS